MAKARNGTEPGGAGEETRRALVAAALALFGAKGFEATSTREIAAAADANIASIAYHFGGKEGLRLACARAVSARLAAVAGAAVFDESADRDPDLAQAAIERVVSTILGFLLGEREARDIAAFILRELGRPGAVFDAIYDETFLPVHRRLCRLLGSATGHDPESEFIRLGVFTLLGQVIYFRIGYFIVARRMEWDPIGPAEIDAVRRAVIGNIRTFVAANRKAAAP